MGMLIQGMGSQMIEPSSPTGAVATGEPGRNEQSGRTGGQVGSAAIVGTLRHVGNISEDNAAIVLQATWRGFTARRALSVRSVGPGLILTRVTADSSMLHRMGLAMDALDDIPTAVWRFAILAVDQTRYLSTVSMGSALAKPGDFLVGSPETVAVINGGFYNFEHRVSADAPEHAVVGSCRTGGREHSSLPIPPGYSDDYVTLDFEDGSAFHTAPRLSIDGSPSFSRERLLESRYRLSADFDFAVQAIRPGELQHAADPNPRAAISRPGDTAHGYARLAVGLAQARGRGAASGYSLAQWSQLMARIDRMEQPPNSSFNLDGGGSVALVVATGDGRRINVMQSTPCRDVANCIRIVQRDAF
jgi:hypothetical protein